jgi:hypothetical protein
MIRSIYINIGIEDALDIFAIFTIPSNVVAGFLLKVLTGVK